MTATHVAVCPSVHAGWTRQMRDTCAFTVNVWDNTLVNAGTSRAWNWGVEQMRAHGADWLVIVSASVRFGPSGGMDFIAALDDPDAIAVEGAPDLGWHLIGIRSEVFDRVGLFDENYMPGYLEEIDFSRRVSLAYDLDPPYWRKVEVDATITGYGEGVRLAGIDVPIDRLMAYEARKHGGHPGDPDARLFDHPFDDPSLPWSWWPPKGDPRGSGQMP